MAGMHPMSEKELWQTIADLCIEEDIEVPGLASENQTVEVVSWTHNQLHLGG